MKHLTTLSIALLLMTAAGAAQAADSIIRDAEYHILQAQHGVKWNAEDKIVEERLAQIRNKNGGKRGMRVVPGRAG
jgi:arylsulfatase